MTDEQVPCYISRCLCGCGAVKFAAVDEPGQSKDRKADTAHEIAMLIRDGYIVERSTVGEVRAANWKCSGVGKTEGNK